MNNVHLWMPTLGELHGDRLTTAQHHMQHGFRWQPYCLLILDLLGSGAQLEAHYPMPADGRFLHEQIQALSDHATKVIAWRDNIIEFAQGYSLTDTLPDDFDPRRSDHRQGKETLDRFRAGRIHSQMFGDSFLLFAPLTQPGDMLNLRPIVGILAAASFAMLSGLAVKTPLRGAIDIALGTALHDGDIYGPVLSHVHALESRFAKHPRVLVGDNFREVMNEIMKSSNGSSGYELATRAMAEHCRSLIYTDNDRCQAVEYAGKKLALIYTEDYRQLLENDAKTFVATSLATFASQNRQDLVDRYRQVLQYLQSRTS